MSTLAIGSPLSPITTGMTRPSSSPEGASIADTIRKVISNIRLDTASRNAAFSELSAIDDGPDAYSVDYATICLAVDALAALPSDLPTPEIAVDPDGEISFDWIMSGGRNFSLSLRGDGRLSYAGSFRLNHTRYGTDTFEDKIPKEVVEAVRDLVKGV